ncbi:hypothetical protein C2G38_2155832 [Gigaspora rosea]|uniref:Uncharacterized protein n=1 Tax=Gigaspora rosea TaxID=44941 RepID=A0A397W9W7_9GLOM|nr:hypothetical protein C2G38_2155832 [Gigaspora rosea]
MRTSRIFKIALKLFEKLSDNYLELLDDKDFNTVINVGESPTTKFELILIAYELFFDELAKHLKTHLIENGAHWIRLNFTRIYQKSFQNNKLQELQKLCNDIVVNILIKSKNLESYYRVGIAQNSGLPTNPENWSNENFLALKTTLRNCLPHIRYFQISGDGIIDNVQPYHQVLEKNFWKDVTNKLISPNQQVSSIIPPPRIILTPKLPSRNTEQFSTVINEAHVAEIAS